MVDKVEELGNESEDEEEENENDNFESILSKNNKILENDKAPSVHGILGNVEVTPDTTVDSKMVY
tara:strand:+ start:916 stop:1110 length:195 start_codon:yes stop_codon:yes gene_type:complete